MPGKNDHIKKFIDYYSKLTVVPEYALLIKGPWGCGKSHLVQQCMDELKANKNPINFLYVSLYGITSVEDIEANFFQQLNPKLFSKRMVLAGRLAKGLLKGVLKIDIADINLAEYMTDTRDYVLVFDDLERSSMELKSILGYINYFVEKDGYKVILIAEEEKMVAATSENDDADKFELVKEKLIGKTLEVEADIDSVFELFLENIIEDADLKVLLKENKSHIILNFDKSNFGNLRSLRKMLLEFNRLWSVLDDEVKEKPELISELLKLFSILSMEIYSGSISPSEIKELIGGVSVVRAIEEKNNPEKESDKYKDIEGKYNVSFLETIISIEEWEAFFGRGFIDSKKINESLKITKYFTKENTPNWINLWHFHDLEDNEFDQLYKSVRAKFDNHEYLIPGEIKHVSAMWLDFSRRCLIEQTVAESLTEIKAYIDTVFLSGHVNANIDETSLELINGFGSYANLGYSDADTAEFKEMSEHLNEKVREVQAIKLAERSTEIIDAIKTDPDQLYTLLCHSNYQQSPFVSRPIMQYIPSQDFMELLHEISNTSKRRVADALSYRYEHPGVNTPLLAELPWLEEVVTKLGDTIDNTDKVKPSSIVFEYMKSQLDKALAKLQASQAVEPIPK